jgi:ABC-type transport system substrate-binding protein
LRKFVLGLTILLSLACASRSPDGDEAGEGEGRQGRPPTLVIAVPDEPDQLVPPFSRSPASAAIWPWVLPSLVRVAGDSLGRGRIEGDLAVSWQSEDGGKSVRFFLDAGRLWEDTTSVGAADVVESYRLYRDPALGGEWAKRLEEIASVEAPGDGGGTVLFRFRRALSRTRALQLAALPLISSEQWAKTKDRKPALGEPGRPVHSAGPFRIEEWRPGEYLRLVRNPFAPEGRTPRSERILLRFVPAGRSRVLQLQAGVADCAIDLPAEEIPHLRDEFPDLRLMRAGACGAGAIAWNLDDPIWGGLALRRALCAALDVDRLRRAAAGEAEGSIGAPCRGFLLDARTEDAVLPSERAVVRVVPDLPVAPAVSAAPAESAASPVVPAMAVERAVFPPDSTARSAIATVEALPSSSAAGPPATGVAAGPTPAAVGPVEEATPIVETPTIAPDLSTFGPPTLEILYCASEPRRERVAIELALQLDKLGVPFRLSALSEDECADRIAQRRFEAVVLEYALPSLPDLGEVYGTGGAGNVAGLSDASTDSLIALARSAAADTIPDAWDRVELRATAMLPCLFFERRLRIDGLGPRAGGYHPAPNQPYGDLLTLVRQEAPVASSGGRGRR